MICSRASLGKEKHMRFPRFIRRHWVAFLLCGVSLLVTMHFHKKSVAEREPVFLIGARIQIIESDHMGKVPLTILDQNDERLTGNVTAVRLYFWNRGTLAIKRENILIPLQLSLDDPNGRILEARILRESRHIIGAEVRPITDSTVTLGLDFDILEQNDGFFVQAIYEGDPDAPWLIRGTVEGVKEILGRANLVREQFWKEYGKHVLRFVVVCVVVYGLYCLLGVCLDWLFAREFKQEPTPSCVKKTMAVVGAAALLIFLIMYGVWALGLWPVRDATDKASRSLENRVPSSIVP